MVLLGQLKNTATDAYRCSIYQHLFAQLNIMANMVNSHNATKLPLVHKLKLERELARTFSRAQAIQEKLQQSTDISVPNAPNYRPTGMKLAQ